MSLQKLQFTPGLNRDQTNYANEGGWYACDKIRFRSGYPQKLGGWRRYGEFTIIGACRQMFNWVTSYGDNFMALGTNEKLYLEAGTNLYNITPLRATYNSASTPTSSNTISVTNGSRIVTIDLSGFGSQTGDYVEISGVVGSGSPANIGGIPVSEINANHKLTRVTANQFTIQVATAATSTVSSTGGTSIVYKFEIPVGFPTITYGYGFGTGAWSTGMAWGAGSTQPINIPQRDWWMDNFDNDLVANIRNGPIYYWERGALTNPATALAGRAILLADLPGADAYVPDEAMQILVSQNDKHLLAFGCTPLGGGESDPLLIRWASQDAPGTWFPEPTNSAGFIRVSRGSRIIRALAARQEVLVWTDSNLYGLQYLGTTDVFGLQEYADNISIIGPRAVVTVNNVTYWMGHDKFYAYSGRVETLPCTLRNHVFENINYAQADQIVCGTNEGWNEVWWFYPTKDSNYNNAYVVYNHLERIWYYGTIERTAWLDTPLRDYGQAIKTDPTTWTGTMFNHEQGTNDDTLPMYSYIQSSDFDITDGENFTLIKRIIPDIGFAGSTAAAPVVNMTVTPRNFPGSAYMSEPEEAVQLSTTIPVEQYTNQVFIRARARQMGLKVSSDGLDVQWQLGAPRIDGRPDGKR